MFTNILKRPVFAIVISILICFVGVLSMMKLPISQFPSIAPTIVNIFVAYPGASADVLIKSTIIPLETSINGVPGMRYISSDATSAGEGTIRIIFEPGTDADAAIVQVKTRVDQVMPNLPPLVQREGVQITPIQPSMLLYINLASESHEAADEKFLYNYAYTKIIPELQRIQGIARADILGARKYAIRIWLNPDRMRAYKISAEDVMEALDEQSIIGRPGRLGLSSGIKSQSKEYVLNYSGRFNTEEQYGDIIIKSTEEGQQVKLSHIANIELGSEFFDIYSNLDGKPSSSIVLKQTLGSNGNEVIKAVKSKMKDLEKDFPIGISYQYSYDVSTFLNASIEQVIHTIRDAFLLVALVVFIFLGDWRATLIPILAVPVSLVGSFIFMQAFGLSINLITLFALVLAIGIVVDNAIVIVEGVYAKMEHDKKISPFEATKQAMNELSGAIIAITLVMTSVFVPIAFMSGPVGVFYRQFSITMASSIVISGVVALTLTPVLCAMLLKNHHGKKKKLLFDRFIDSFNKIFESITGKYVVVLNKIVMRRIFTILILIAFYFGLVFTNKVVPSGFVPNEDQSTIYAIIQTPPGSTLEQTNEVAGQLQQIAEEIEEVESVTSLAGYEIMTEGRGSNAGTCLIDFKSWSERDKSVHEIMKELEEKTSDLGAIIEYFEPPAVPGFGTSGGFAFRLIDKTDATDYQEFDQINKEFLSELSDRRELTGLFTFYAANYPQYNLEFDNQAAMQKGVSLGAAMENLNILIGSTYEQGFIKFGRFFKVYTQAAPEFRRYVSDLDEYFVKNEEGEMVPYSSFMHLKETQGPNEITRYNLYNSAAILGLPSEGFTTGEAIDAIKEVAATTLPKGFDIAWEGLSYDEAARGNESFYIFLVVVFFVYLVLAAQYESFLLPLAVLLYLPMGLLGSLLFLKMWGLANDVYAQIGMIMLIGLLGKNAVLIVEFAIQKHHEGMSVYEAAVASAKARFRPILMTSFAFVAGIIPLVVATGAGAIGNRTIGAASLGGMLFGTIFGVLIIPSLYYLLAKMVEGRKLLKEETDTPITETFADDETDESLFKKLEKFARKNKNNEENE